MRRPCRRLLKASYGLVRSGHDFSAYADSLLAAREWSSLRAFDSEPSLYARASDGSKIPPPPDLIRTFPHTAAPCTRVDQFLAGYAGQRVGEASNPGPAGEPEQEPEPAEQPPPDPTGRNWAWVDSRSLSHLKDLARYWHQEQARVSRPFAHPYGNAPRPPPAAFASPFILKHTWQGV